MKPFDLEKAKAGAKVCLKNGVPARIVFFDVRSAYPIVALVEDGDSERVLTFNNEGRFYASGIDDSFDLAMAQEKHEGWVNIYRTHSGGRQCGIIYSTKDEAEKNVSNLATYITTDHIEWEE